MTNLKLVVVAAVSLFAGGCVGAEAADADDTLFETSLALPASCTALGTTINNHACQHGALGPFGSVTASSNPNFAMATPNLSGIHRYFSVTLPASGSVYAGTVKFTPAATDDHAIYVHPSVLFAVRDKNGNAVPAALTGTLSGCSYLTSYKVYALSTSTTLAPYKIDLAAPTSAVKVTLEEVAPMRERWYQDADGDTYGAPSPSVLTACVPPAGYSVKRAGDCNDANVSIRPGALETPSDGIDSNCNGSDNS